MINGLTERGKALKELLKKEGNSDPRIINQSWWEECTLIHKVVVEKVEYTWTEQIWVDVCYIFPENPETRYSCITDNYLKALKTAA